MGKAFIPTSENQRALRDAFGCFATGVTVITTLDGDRPIGITANSFTSVSLDPALIAWCPAKSSDRLSAFQASTEFAVHILNTEQADMALGFAKEGSAFDGSWQPSPTGVPLQHNSLCILECQRVAQHDAGDHIIMLGQVNQVHINEGSPLVFERGRFGQFGSL